MRTKTLSAILLWLALSLLLPSGTPAAVVGRITQVEGKVDLLKKGQLPATPVKHNDGVEPGDVIRTKSLSKAQITFVDQSVLTISPGTRITIEKYMVGGGKRNAVLQMFQGVALAVVSKIFKSEGPNFVVKTNTAIMGIRGTEVGIRLYPNFSEFLNFQGRTSIRNRFPEIRGEVELSDGQGTRVARGLPPTFAFGVSPQDREQFMHQLASGLNARVRGKDSSPGASGSQESQLARGSSGGDQLILVSIPSTLNPQEQQKQEEPTVQPVVEKPPPPPPPPPLDLSSEHVVNWSGSGQYTMVKGTQSGEGDPHYATYTGSLTLTNGSQVNFTILAQDPLSPGNFNQSSSGTITWDVNGTLKLIDGTSSYRGTVSAKGDTLTGGTIFTFTLDAIYNAVDGKLTLSSVQPVNGGYISKSTTGDFTQPTESSHKITEGTAQIISLAPISYTSTTEAASTSAGTTTSIAPTVSTTSALSPAVSIDTAVVSSGITTLPPPTTLTAAGPPGQAVSAAAPGQAAATAMTPMAPSVVTPSGVAPPGLQNLPAAANGPPGQSQAPGQTGNAPPGHAYGHSK
jgi:hypothetical protein